MDKESVHSMKSEQGSSDDEDYKAIRFAQLYSANEKYLRAFVFSLIPNRDSVDEIVQQSSLVLWRKFDDLRCDSEFLKWAYSVTRYEVLAFRRTKARNKLYFDSDLVGQMAEEFVKDVEGMWARNDAVVGCYESLPDSDKAIAKNVFSLGMKIVDVAKLMGRDQSKFYKAVRRLRHRLMKCVEQKLREEE